MPRYMELSTFIQAVPEWRYFSATFAIHHALS